MLFFTYQSGKYKISVKLCLGEKWEINTMHRNSIKYSIKIFLHPSRRVVFKLNHSDEYILHHCTEVHNCLSSQKQ